MRVKGLNGKKRYQQEKNKQLVIQKNKKKI